jgi:hypothetical protein
MWKYILIIAFLLFAIREINLMNESLYIAPDTHEVVVKDKTVIGKVVKVVEKIEKIKESKMDADTRQSKPESQTAPSLSRFEEQNNSAKQLKKLSSTDTEPSLQQIEKEAQHAAPKQHLSSHPTGSAYNTQRVKKISSKRDKKVTINPPVLIYKSKHNEQPYPETYQRAQEKVNAILRQMRGTN